MSFVKQPVLTRSNMTKRPVLTHDLTRHDPPALPAIGIRKAPVKYTQMKSIK
ncbi:hypothetical protein HanXRQr2_Chr09g0397061 [Helianthus annuus]|uniref:Uncharacterized protein n=1 Tax=Helianthus annuus TaxID=4232 RepID=A0A9K3I7M5_HELAN|nr:hypothetical protein HanXRQr2_Chr09g0397061 [Helianthus annuus]KAJ0893883.1 hypothetical protein HanPSC8_Chr09g0382821 [Helianthus annuus]